MRLSEALTIVRTPVPTPATATPFSLALMCGFTPLHLETFVNARLRIALPRHEVTIHSGVYGDLADNLERTRRESLDAAAIVMEWSDLDSRLGLRSLGGWGESAVADILDGAARRLTRLQHLIVELSSRCGVVVSLPGLGLPPLQPTVPTFLASSFALRVRDLVSAFAVRLSGYDRIQIVNPEWIDRASHPADRFDAGSELLSGFPYTISHASVLSESLVRLIQTPSPKKGIITDLDDTLWKGIVGEIGAANVSWSLDGHAHMHGVYQALLRSLAEMGVLIAVASKNDAAVVDEVFRRPDLVLPIDRVFPVEVHWSAKSGSVDRVLQAWNVGAESVVFVDDSPSELAEVQAAHPAVECIRFPRAPRDIDRLIARLRDLFAKPLITEEDRIRLDSLRRSGPIASAGVTAAEDISAFHQQASSVLTFTTGKNALDARALELVNKTNQFNLNGQRYTDDGLRRRLGETGAFLMKASYADKYGPLGVITVVIGHAGPGTLTIDSWVMSCRAFSRRIEYACLDHLFRRFDVAQIDFNFAVTDRNKPLRDFFAELLSHEPASAFSLPRQMFHDRSVPLFHTIEENVVG